MAIASNCPSVRKVNLRGCYRSDFVNGQDNISNAGIMSLAKGCSYIEQVDLAWHSYLNNEAMIAIAHNCQEFQSAEKIFLQFP
jgi:hypothetical protein